MHDTVTTASSPTAIYPTPPISKLTRSFAPQPRPLTVKDSLGWFYPNDSPVEPSFEHWNLSSPDTLISSQRAISPEFRKYSPLTIMPTRTTTESSKPSTQATNQRWQYNHAGQYVDMGAESANWDITDEMGRLNIGDVTADNNDEPRFAAIRTPPKSKLVSAAVAQAAENSPLDTASNSSASPHVSDHPISHSRGSSADTTLSSRDSAPGGNNLLTHAPVLTQKTSSTEAKGRPHSFSGGLSSADLRRLQTVGDSDHDRQQQQQWYREQAAEQQQPSYPSLSNQVHRPAQQQQQQQAIFTYPSNAPASVDRDREDSRSEYNAQHQQRNFAPHMGMNTGAQYAQSRPNNNANYRQTQRSFATQNYGGGHHTSHMSLGNNSQLYDMMMPGQGQEGHHPAVTRVQQQHNVFRQTHHHSASDPSGAMRDVNALAAISQPMPPAMPGYNPQGMFGTPGLMAAPPPQQQQAMQAMYVAAAGQPAPYYSAQEIAVQQAQMAARLQAQYSGAYSSMGSVSGLDHGDIGSPTSSSGQTGPSANNRKLGLYKTELCRSWEEKGTCRYSTKCQFAHGEDELRRVSRHPKYKTEICKTFWVSGSCPYGKRCCFIHTELSASGQTGPGSEGTPPPSHTDGRERSNSDPDGTPVSLLARISQRNHQQDTPSASATPVDNTNSGSYQFTRPPTGSLRVDTSTLDAGVSLKQQNKSAYPSFAGKGIILPAPEHISAKSPAPVTAGPDLGRHNISRMEIVGYPNHQKKNSSSSNPRHSFTGSEDITYSQSPPATGENNAGQAGPASRVNGHARSGSAGNWGGFGRSSNLATSAYPHAASPAGEIMGGASSPWSSTELAVGTSRLHEKAWA